VRIEWVEPTNPAAATSRKEKLAFAKQLFLRNSEALPTSTQTTEGIVVVFDSADGGQIAASLASVKALSNHSLSDDAFWRQCSVDPPDSSWTSLTTDRAVEQPAISALEGRA
jgi:hypothetical protein